MKTPQRVGRDANKIAEVESRHNTRREPRQQSSIAKLELRPYSFRLKDGKGGGTYLTFAPTLNAARAELLRRWADELLSITKGTSQC
jgi:hypothetical protein